MLFSNHKQLANIVIRTYEEQLVSSRTFCACTRISFVAQFAGWQGTGLCPQIVLERWFAATPSAVVAAAEWRTAGNRTTDWAW